MQISPAFAHEVVSDFFAWVDTYDERESNWDHGLLQEYIVAWLIESKGRTCNCVMVTGSQFDHFLLAVLIIIDAYQKDPSSLDYHGDGYRERRVDGLIDLEHPSARYFEKYQYQQEVFRHLLGRSE